jgi:hypothetical protein
MHASAADLEKLGLERTDIWTKAPRFDKRKSPPKRNSACLANGCSRPLPAQGLIAEYWDALAVLAAALLAREQLTYGEVVAILEAHPTRKQ